jgi:anaerobic selenocysteine-containing dehydrogenase
LPLQAKDLPSVCVLCSHNCGIRVDVEEGRIAAVRADATNPITEGYLCNKAFSVSSYVNHEQRVQTPLRRCSDGRFERVSWDAAIAEIAGRLAEIRSRHAPRAIGLVGIGGQANHMDAPYGLAFLSGAGSKMWFNALAQEKTQHFLMDQWMFAAAPTLYLHADLDRTRYLLVLGTNPRISNRGHNANETFKHLSEDPQRTLVVVDPRETETTRSADFHLRVRPGTDAYLLLAMAAILVSRDLTDEAFLGERVQGWPELRAALQAVDVDEMATRCGVEREAIEKTALDFGQAECAAIMYDLAVEQIPFSTLISYLIRVLLTLTGNIGRIGGNLWLENLSPPRIDPARVSEPARALVSGIEAIRAIGNAGMFSPTLVPEEVLVDHPERLRALIVEGSNPVLSYSDTSRWREARERLELLVVIEPAMSETAQWADYVLPTPVGYEKWEVAAFWKRHPQVHVQLRPPVVPGPEQALPEPEIYARLAEAMGLFGEPPPSLAQLAPRALEPEGAGAWLAAAMEAAAGSGGENAVLFWAYRTVGTYLPAPSLVATWLQCHQNALERREAVNRTLGPEWEKADPFRVAAELFRRILDHPEGVEIACARDETNLEDHLGYDDGKIRLAPGPMLAEMQRALASEPVEDPDYPFVLACGLRTRWTANTIQRDPKWRKGRGPHCALHLCPTDAEKLGLVHGDPTRISTPRGSVVLPAAIDPKLRAGHVWIPNGFGAAYPENGELVVQGANLNELTDASDRDPITGCPHHKAVRCRIERGEA